MPLSYSSENEISVAEETTQEVEVIQNLKFQKTSWIIKYIRTLALGLTILSTSVTTGGCASTSQNNKASESVIKELIAKLGARNSGLQIREDGTITGIINCEDDLDRSKALLKAEELNRSILEQTPDKTTSATKKLGDRTFTCVRGEINPEPKTIDDGIKKLLEGTGYNQVGIFNDTVIQYGEGDSEESAIADAKKNIEFFLPAGTYTRTNTKTLQLKRGENKDRWIALMHVFKKPTKADSSKTTVSVDQSEIKITPKKPKEFKDYVLNNVKRSAPAIRSCYNRILKNASRKRKKAPEGTIMFKIELNALSGIKRVRAIRDSLKEIEVTNCTIRQITRWRFPKEYAKATFYYPMSFKKTD